MKIEWANFFVVAGVAILGTVVLATLYGSGVRLLSDGHAEGSGVRVGAACVCFGLCVAAVLFGLWLIIPQFHP